MGVERALCAALTVRDLPGNHGKVLAIVYRIIATHLINKAGVPRNMARTGAVTLIQRFGSALKLNLHFRWVHAPTSAELTELAQPIAQRIGRYLQRQGLLKRDAKNSYLAGELIDEGQMDPLWGYSIACRIAVRPQAGRKVLMLQSLPGR